MSIVSDIDFNVNRALKKLDDLETKVDRSFKRQSKGAEREEKRKGDAAEKAAGRMKAAWLAATAFVGTMLVQMASRIQSRLFEVAAASEEAASKFAVTFGDRAKAVDEFVNTFGKLAGLSKTEGREVTATLGAVALGFGASRGEAADFAQEVVRAAADMSSFNNTPMPEMLQAIRSGLAGEIEPLRRYGIELRAASVDQMALAMTGKTSAEALTTQEKTLARLALIQDQAAVQMGDLERTQASAANQYRKLTANIRNKAEEMSQRLLPVMTRVITSMNEYFATSTDMAASIKTTKQELDDLATAHDAVQIVEDLQKETGLSADEQDRLRESLDLLQDKFPGFVQEVDETGHAISLYTEELRKAIEAQQDLAAIEMSATFRDMVSDFDDANDRITEIREERDRLLGAISRDEGMAADPSQSQENRNLARAGAIVSRGRLSDLGLELQGLEAQARTFRREVAGLVETLGEDRIVTAFMAAGRSADDARAYVAELVAESERLSEAERLRQEQEAEAAAQRERQRQNREVELGGIAAEMKALKERQAVLVAQGEDTEELRTVNVELVKLEERRKQLLDAGVAAYQRQKQAVGEIKGMTPRDLEFGTRFAVGTSVADANEIMAGYNLDVIRLKATIDNPEELEAQLARLRAAAEAEMTAVLGRLREIIKATGDEDALKAFDEVSKSMKEMKGDSKEIETNFGAIASAGRSLLSLAGVFGVISDDVRDLATGVVDLADNLGQLNDLDADAGLFEKAVPMLGIGTGALSGIVSLGRILMGDSDREERRRVEEAQKRLADALDDNARRISSSIDRLLRDSVVGAQVTGEQADDAADLLRDLIFSTTSPLTSGRAQFEWFSENVLPNADDDIIREMFDNILNTFGGLVDADQIRADIDELVGDGWSLENAIRDVMSDAYSGGLTQIFESAQENMEAFFEDLEDLDIEGLDVDAFRDQFQTLIDSGMSIPDALDEIFFGTEDFTGIQEVIDTLVDEIGAAGGGSVQGLIDRFNLLGQFLDENAGDSLRRFVESLLDSSVAISDEFRAGLESFLSGETSQQAFRAWLTQLAERLAAGGDTSLLDGISSDDFESLLDMLEGLTQTSAAGGTTSSASNFRSITEVQADFVSDLLRESVHFEERTALAAEAILGILNGQVPASGQSTSTRVSPVQVNLTVQSSSNRFQTVREAQRMIGQELNEALIQSENRLF